MNTWIKDSTTADRANAAKRWLTLTDDLGLSKPFEAARAYLARAREIQRDVNSQHSTLSQAIAEIAADLAESKLDSAQAYKRLVEADASNSDNMRTVFTRAITAAETRAFYVFDIGGDKLHKLAKDRVDALVAKIREDAPLLDGIHTIDMAKAAGSKYVAAWARIQEALEPLKKIYTLTDGWRANGFLPLEGDYPPASYAPNDFRWGAPEELPAPLQGGRGTEDATSYFARNLHLKPGLYTLAEVDTYRAAVRARDGGANEVPVAV